MPVMAYSPIEQGRLPTGGVLGHARPARTAARAFQIALAWVLAQPGVMAIPKAVALEHVEANAAALDLALSPEDLAAIDREFPPPTAQAAAGDALSEAHAPTAMELRHRTAERLRRARSGASGRARAGA